jgi:hypothetical protein
MTSAFRRKRSHEAGHPRAYRTGLFGSQRSMSVTSRSIIVAVSVRLRRMWSALFRAQLRQTNLFVRGSMKSRTKVPAS